MLPLFLLFRKDIFLATFNIFKSLLDYLLSAFTHTCIHSLHKIQSIISSTMEHPLHIREFTIRKTHRPSASILYNTVPKFAFIKIIIVKCDGSTVKS